MIYADEGAEPFGPRWLRAIFGEHFFSSVVLVQVIGATDDDLIRIGQLKSVEFVDLSHSPKITNEGLASIGQLSNITELYLYDTGVTGQGLAHLRGLGKLGLLVLDDTQVGDEGVVHLRDLERLSYLGLAATGLTDDGVASLSSLPSLRDVNLADNQLTDESLLHLRFMYPFTDTYRQPYMRSGVRGLA